MAEAFTYCWTDKKNDMLYIGCHKGTTDDGYVCSSNYMSEAYKERPNDFSRQIIAFGTYTEMRNLETALLKAENAMYNKAYYNRTNGDGNYTILCHTKETKSLIAQKATGRARSEESKAKQSKSMSGSGNHFYGKTHSEEFRKKQSDRKKISQAGANHNQAKKVKYNGVVYGCIKDMINKTGISSFLIKKMIKNGQAELCNGK